MQITIEHHDKQFNVALSSSAGKEPFLVIKGCRLMNGSKGEFVSWPARKQDDGRWWNHVYASEDFQKAVLDAVHASQPKRPSAPRDDMDRVPF
jgi:DNA-binding cell septation regulator SpoVG